MNVDSDTQITATTPPGNGTVDVIVTTPAGTSAAGAADQFTYDGTTAGPQVTGIDPASGSVAGGDTVTITGSGFTGATDVSIGPASAPAMNVDSDTQITATTPPGSGTVDVIVTTPAGASAATTADQFTYGDAAPGSGSGVMPQGAAAAAPTVGGGVTFDFLFNQVKYTATVFAPDPNGQYGFKITQGANTIASLVYKDDNNWAIAAGLPSALQVDTNLTVSTLNVDITKGTVTPPS